MSRYGRCSDGLYDILDGHDTSMNGDFEAGPLHHLPPREISFIVDKLMNVVTSTYGSEWTP